MKKPHIRENVRSTDKQQADISQLYVYLLIIASQPLHTPNTCTKALLIDLARAWKVSA